MDRVDVVPLHVRGAQQVRVPLPRRIAHRGTQALDVGPRLGIANPQQRIGRLVLGVREVIGAIEPEQARERLVGNRRNHARLPSECGGRVRHRRDGVSAIVLAIAPRAHAVLPRLAPMDRAHADEQAALRPGQRRALLERMVAAHVVVEPARQTRHRRAEQVRLRRMQVAARGIAPQRPAIGAERLPRREPERQLEEGGYASQLDRRGRRESSRTHIVMASGERISRKRQSNSRRAFERAKRIRLVRPVEPARSWRIAPQAVLAALVVLEEGGRRGRIGDGGHADMLTASARSRGHHHGATERMCPVNR